MWFWPVLLLLFCEDDNLMFQLLKLLIFFTMLSQEDTSVTMYLIVLNRIALYWLQSIVFCNNSVNQPVSPCVCACLYLWSIGKNYILSSEVTTLLCAISCWQLKQFLGSLLQTLRFYCDLLFPHSRSDSVNGWMSSEASVFYRMSLVLNLVTL